MGAPLVPALEALRAPALAVQHHREASLRAQMLADLGQHLLLQHRQQAVVGRGSDEEPRIAVAVVDPVIGGRRHGRAQPGHPGLGQGVLASVIGAHVAVHMKEAHRLLAPVLDPPTGEGLEQREALLPAGQLEELAANRLDLRGPVQPQQPPELAGGVGGELLGRLDPQQRHERQRQEHRIQPVEPVLELAVDPVKDLEEALRHQHRNGKQDAGPGHALGPLEPGRRLFQLALGRQGPLDDPLDRNPAGSGPVLRVALPGGRSLAFRLRSLPPRGTRQPACAERVADRPLCDSDRLGRTPVALALVQQLLGPLQPLASELVGRTPLVLVADPPPRPPARSACECATTSTAPCPGTRPAASPAHRLRR